MTLFKEILFDCIEPCFRDFAIQPKTFTENKTILQKYCICGGPEKVPARLSYIFSSLNYDKKDIYSNISLKYALLKEALNNKFSSQEDYDCYLGCFSRAQKKYFAFSRLAFIYRFKKAIIRNEEDMFMLPISDTEKKVIVVYENNNKYLFRHSEILKICQNSLCNASENDLDYIEPRPMKNPYTNIPFNKSTLFYMYDTIANGAYKIPLLFQTFFLCNFNLKELWIKHSPFITNLTIKDYINNAPPKILTGTILAMLEHIEEQHDIDFKFNISPEFDRNELNTIMKPYLELFLQSFHNHNDFFSNRCVEELKYKLKVLYTKNPNFGRKKITLSRNYINMQQEVNVTKNIIFNAEHNNFTYSTSLDNFKESHSYTGFIDDVDFLLNDPYFENERMERFIREQRQNQPFNLINRNRRINRNRSNRDQTPHLLRTVRQFDDNGRPIYNNNQSIYNEEEQEDNVSNSNTTITISSNEDEMVGLYDENNNSDTDNLESTIVEEEKEEEEVEDLFDDIMSVSTVDLSEINASEFVDENKPPNEEGEIIRVETPQYFNELQNISTQVRSLLNDENILVIDGRERLLSLLSQIDNLHHSD